MFESASLAPLLPYVPHFFAVLYVYFFPAIIAFIRGHEDAGGVLFANLALGWTVVGWFAVLVWGLDVKRQ